MLQIVQHILNGANNKNYVLVTVVSQVGSTPRGIGSQMLVSSEGLECGTVGGGAIENHAIQQAQQLLLTGESMLEEVPLAVLNMTCGGENTLLYSFVDTSNNNWINIAKSIQECLDNQEMTHLLLQRPEDNKATIENNAVLLSETGEVIAGNADLAGSDLDLCARGYLCEAGFIMPLPLPHRAIVFGAGHVAHALVPLLNNVGFACTVYDYRPELATKERFPDARNIICESYENASKTVSLSPRDYVIIMTNSHESDFTVLEQILRHEATYVGFMGSRRKIATARKRALEAGISEEALNAVHWPIGLDIKAETPAEIAVSVVAECITHRASL